MRYIIDLTCLMLQLVYFVFVFVFAFMGFTEHFLGFGLVTHVFGASGFGVSFVPLRIRSFFFFFWFGAMLTRFMRKPERI